MESVESIRAMTLLDDVSDDYSINDGTESDELYVEPGEGDQGVCRRRYVEWLLLHWSGRYWQFFSLEKIRRSVIR